MAEEVKLPELGEGVDSGDVLEILVAVGDVIKKDQGIVELETEKATISVPSSHAGKVTKIHVAAGDTIRVGQSIISLETAAASAEKPKSTAAKTAAKEPAAKEPTAKKPADKKPSQEEKEQPAPAADNGDDAPSTQSAEPERRQKVAAEAGRQATPSAAKPAAPAQPEQSPDEPELASPAGVPGGMGSVPAGPAIRRFAREVGVDLRQVEGTGSHGRITRDDVLHVVRQGSASARAATTQEKSSGTRDDFGPIRIEKLSRIRRTIAEKMHLSWTTVPRVTNFDDADVTDLEEFRNESKGDYAKQGVKLTSLPFVIKAVATSLKLHPLINATIDLEAGQLILKDYINIGIAVDTDRGLLVPILRDADKLSIPQIARSLQTIADEARKNQFKMEDLRGGSFTISNLGAIGGTYSTPIINVPETAILLIGRSRKMPVVIEDKVAIRLMMPLSISYDHRLIDGSTAARFLNEVIGYLQAPSRLLLSP